MFLVAFLYFSFFGAIYTFRVTAVLTIEIEIITSITASSIKQAGILVKL